MTTLVTGAAGFIGSHVAEKLLLRGDAVLGLDNLNDYYPVAYKKQNVELLRSIAPGDTGSNFHFQQLDLADLPQLRELFRAHKITRIAHLAARAGVRPSIQDPLLYAEANIQGTLHLLELAKEFHVENFVLTSSSSVYGNSKSVPFSEDDSATDKPISPYAATKKATELLGYTYHHLFGLNINVIRPFTVYGPRGRPDMAPWLFLEAALTNKPIKQFGDGSTRRDYTYIDDFVSGFIAALDRPLGFEIFNLGNSQTVSLKEMLDVVERVSGKSLTRVPHPMQPGDVECTFADISKAKRMLDYAPTTAIQDGMKLFFDWYLDSKRLS